MHFTSAWPITITELDTRSINVKISPSLEVDAEGLLNWQSNRRFIENCREYPSEIEVTADILNNERSAQARTVWTKLGPALWSSSAQST